MTIQEAVPILPIRHLSILSQLLKPHALSIVLALCVSPHSLLGFQPAPPEIADLDGLPFYTIYGVEQLGGGLSSPQLTEDQFGRVVLADENRLMTFDGHSWVTKHKHGSESPETIVSTFPFNGRLYAGCIGAWGELLLNEDGNYKFERFPNSDASWASGCRFSDILMLDGNIYFIGNSGVVRRSADGTETYWTALKNVQSAFIQGDTLVIARAEEGLFRLKDDKWIQLPGTEVFSAFDSIYHSEAISPESAIVATLSGKLFRVTHDTVERWNTDADIAMEQGVSALQHLGDGFLAVAVTGVGIIALDPDGAVVMQLTARQDPTFASINDLYQQEQGILWATLSTGVARVYFPSQLSVIDYRFGLPLLWPQVLQRKGELYIVTEGKLYRATRCSLGRLGGFKKIDLPGVGYIEGACIVDGSFILSSNGTLYEWRGGCSPNLIGNIKGAQRLIHLKAKPDYIVCAGTEAHSLLKKIDQKWTVIDEVPSSSAPLYGLDTPEGDAWVEQGIGLISRIRVESDKLRVEEFNNLSGLEGRWQNLSILSDQLLVSSNRKGLFYDSDLNSFVPAPEFDAISGISDQIFARPTSDRDVIWAPGNMGLLILKRDAGDQWRAEGEISRPVTIPYTLPIPIGDGSAWFTSQRMVIRYNPDLPAPRYKPLRAVITHIEAQNAKSGDSVIFDTDSGDLTLPYSSNNLLLRFFPNSFSLPSVPAYRYRVLGFRNDWSAPFREPVLSLTNLPEGSYNVELELLEQDSPTGLITSFNVTVDPPWYRSWQGALLFVALVAAVILLTIKLVQRRARKEQDRLARIVAARTSELDETNQKLRESVRQATAAAEAKSRFLANMSHEIRTPMNGVVGTTELLSKTPLSDDQRELVEIVNKSGKLLLSIVNDVLDYSKIEAEQIVFESITFNPRDLVEDVLDLLGERANEKGIELFFSIDPSVPYEIQGDFVRLQQILVNLTANAIKFTHDGEVEIAISSRNLSGETVELVVSVRDTGIGIDPEKMDRLFVAFSQLDASNTRIYGGSGLGLVITKRLIECMGGAIKVESVQGEGSVFTAVIPLQVSASQSVEIESRRIQVLLVDRNKARAATTARLLSENGYAAMAMGPDEAIQSLKARNQFDVVIQDSGGAGSWEKVADVIEQMGVDKPRIILMRFPMELVSHSAITCSIAKPWRYRRLLKELNDLSGRGRLPERKKSSHEAVELKSVQNLSVLLAEDNIVNQRVGMLLLKQLGIRPTLAVNGAETVEQVRANKFDVILMDVQMPIMDGIQATQTIRELLPQAEQPVIIALSAGAMGSDREAAFAAGVDAYLTKPLRLEMLHAQLVAASDRIAQRSRTSEARAS